ncbi:MAG: hypothetical protein L0Z46_10255 [Nitrospiraceae bacterium]|nr:hypothetical protein [Nitrospiraceae bacterium]
MAQRFFVTVIAPNQRALVGLGKYDFDFFQPTARATEDQQFMIEGLLTLEEIGHLVEDGYRVLVEEESSKRARARQEVAEFPDWLKGMEE